MARDKLLYSCTECGAQTPKWAGQCPDCGAWNTLVEALVTQSTAPRSARFTGYAGEATVQTIAEVEATPELRLPTGMPELDRVLGGGLVQGSVVLIGGDPGIGKSTLLLQALAALSRKGLTCLYVSGEES